MLNMQNQQFTLAATQWKWTNQTPSCHLTVSLTWNIIDQFVVTGQKHLTGECRRSAAELLTPSFPVFSPNQDPYWSILMWFLYSSKSLTGHLSLQLKQEVKQQTEEKETKNSSISPTTSISRNLTLILSGGQRDEERARGKRSHRLWRNDGRASLYRYAHLTSSSSPFFSFLFLFFFWLSGVWGKWDRRRPSDETHTLQQTRNKLRNKH